MPYLVDGHNLIPKLGIKLAAVDDELELIAVLQGFSRRERRPVEVYFDGAPAGSVGSRRFGAVTAVFVRKGLTADSAISARLSRLAGAARNWIVVSSDRQVRNAARAAHARSLTSEDFATRLQQLAAAARRSGKDARSEQPQLTRQEVDDWLNIFKREE